MAEHHEISELSVRVPPRWRRVIARRRGWIIGVGALVAALVFWLGTFLPRTYIATASVEWEKSPRAAAADGAATLDTSSLYHHLLTDLPHNATDEGVPAYDWTLTAHDLDTTRTRVALMLRSDRAEEARRLLQRIMDRTLQQVRAEARQFVAEAKERLETQRAAASAAEQAAAKALQEFEASHPGILPDDPASVAGKFERTSRLLEERRQRKALVDEQLQRLQTYADRLKHPPTSPPPLTTPTTPTTPTIPAAASRAPTAVQDPEVLQLQAQATLLEEQVQEQLATLRRTEQHPYVVDLRNKQAAVQKKLEEAQARAAAGQPPPTGVKPLPENPTAAAAQSVELQIEQLQAERDTLAGELKTLQTQFDQEQRAVEAIPPARRAYSERQQALEQARQRKAAAETSLQRFMEGYGADSKSSGALPPGLLAVTGPAAMERAAWPRFEWILIAAVAIGGLVGILTSVGIEILRPGFHDVPAFSTVIRTPVLGVVEEIRSPRQKQWRTVWRLIFRPVTFTALLMLAALSGLRCYRVLGSGQPGPSSTIVSGSQIEASGQEASERL